ncbi:MAG: hypothetical protein A2Z97_05030 [Bdellovibrionales bacterium GWB1_52_6]|nr:MAG: hypothetical protein A2Z97_05030 [Bdellovibrionales bacterium GWB1_52_6]OFZ04609.1 MAG: hypothetical protein A2X97_13110 [Bdellovibrionales bacterium GWA1_52_35]
MEHYLDVEEKDSRRADPRTLRKLIPYIARHRLILMLGLLVMGLGVFATLMEPRIFGWAVDLAIIPKDEEMLKKLGLGYLLVVIIRILSAISQAYCFELLGQRIAQDLRCEIYEHLLRAPVATFDKNPVGRLMTRVTNDITSLGEMFSAGFVSMVGNAILVVGILIWLIVLDLKLGLLSLAVFPVLAAITAHFSGKLKIAYREARSRLSALNAFIAENILGIRVVHLFNRQKLHQERFERINQWYSDAQISTVRVFALFQPAITLASGTAIALIIWYGGGRSHEGVLPIGLLIAYFTYVLTLFQPLREMADKWNIFLSGMASAERIFSILSWLLEPGARMQNPVGNSQKSGAPFRGDIEFEHVWFAYSGEHWVLRDLSLKVQAGERLGIVGHTGGGKTTLISLLLRFYEPQRGRILLDGIDIQEYPLTDLRSKFGVIQQDGYLFSGNLKENIGNDLQDLLKTMGMSIEALGLPEELRERASNISTGQKQVLAFARALAAKPQIWILDEATANMDSATERLLQQGLSTATVNRTVLLVAHRLSTIRSADRIAVLNKGILCEQGNHAELLRMNGLYARLYRYQAAKEAQESHIV